MANNINDIVKTKFLERKIGMYNKIIKEYQKEYEEANYENLTRNDRVVCVVCDGTYVKSVKCLHDRSKKHQKKLKELYDLPL